MNSLKKWGDCNIIFNKKRVLPSGIPKKIIPIQRTRFDLER